MAKITLNIEAKNKATATITELSKQISELSASYEKVSAKAQNAAIREEKLATQQKRTAVEAAKEKVQLAKVNVELAKHATQVARTEKVQKSSVSAVDTLRKKYADLLNTIKSIENRYPAGTFDELKSKITQNFNATKELTKGSAELDKAYKKLAADVATVRAETEKNTSAVVQNGDSIGSLAKKFVLWQFAATAVMKPLQMIRNAWASINETLVETENRVVELQRVAGQAANASELYKLAEKYGQTFENVSEAALNFARRGMSWNESLEATEAALLAINVAELDVGQATDGLGSIIAQFGLQASELTNVVDMLNKTADNFPVTTKKILTALQRVGSTATTANLSLEETIGLITTLSKATNRSGENIGTALNSIINMSQKSSTLDVFAGLGGSAREAVEAFRQGGGSILDVLTAVSGKVNELGENLDLDSAEFKKLEAELKESMGEDFEILSDIYATAGIYRRNYFVALLKDLDTVKEVQGEISTANGYSAKENEQYLNTYTAKVNSLKAQWQDFVNDEQGLLGFKKFLVDAGSRLLDLIKMLGGLKTVLLEVSIVGATILFTVKGTAIVSGLKKIITTLRTLTIEAIPNAIAAWKSYAAGVVSANTAIQASIPLLGLAVLGITAATSAIVTSIEKQKRAEEEANRQALESWNAIKDEATALEELSAKYKSLSTDSEEYASVEENLIKLLGTKAIQLANLTKGTEEYRKKVEELAEEQKQYNREIAQGAANAAQEVFDKQKYKRFSYAWATTARENKENEITYTSEFGELVKILEAAGFSFEKKAQIGNGLIKTFARLKLTGDTFKDEGELDRLLKTLLEGGYGNSDFYNTILSAREERSKAISEFLTPIAQNETYKAGDIKTLEEFNAVVNKIMEATGASEKWRNEIEGIVKATSGYNKKLDETINKGKNDLKDISKEWDKVVAKLKEYYDLEKQAADEEERRAKIKEKELAIDEKRLAVAEAEKALEEAKSARKIYRFSEAKGWEWVQDEKEINKAQENVDKANEDLAKAQEAYQQEVITFNKWLQETAWSELLDEIKSNTRSNATVMAILGKYAEKTIGDGTPEWYDKYIGWIKKETGIDVNATPTEESKPQPEPEKPSEGSNKNGKTRWTSYEDAAAAGFGNIRNQREFNRGNNSDKQKYGKYQAYLDAMYEKYIGTPPEQPSGGADIDGKPRRTLHLYDNGGIADGLGTMIKATSRPETVNNPDLTAKILSPTSNAEFDRYVRNMGILFENASRYARQPQIISNAGATTTTNTDNRVTINGMNLTTEQSNQILDLFNMIGLVQR